MRCQSSSPSYQSGIGVRAIRMTARIAPTNAAAPTTANTFLSSFFFAALPIRAVQAMQTAAATSAMPSVSHIIKNYGQQSTQKGLLPILLLIRQKQILWR